MGNSSREVVWITGASAGLGRSMALEFGRQGASLALSARRADLLEDLARELASFGVETLTIPCDVTDESALEQAVARIDEVWGRLDIAIANAGFGVAGPFETVRADDWRRQFEVNVVGLTQTARVALPLLRRSHGRLVLMSSVAALFPSAGTSPYGSSKAAVRAIGQSLSIELHGSGVTCTTIYPGFVESDIGRVNRYNTLVAGARDPRPAALMWKADRAARVMIRAIRRRKRQFVFTGHGRLGAFIGLHFSGLVHHILTFGLLPDSLSER